MTPFLPALWLACATAPAPLPPPPLPTGCVQTSELGLDGSGHRMTYDEEGRLVRRDYDKDGDGVTDSHHTWTYDEAGVLVEEAGESRMEMGLTNEWTYRHRYAGGRRTHTDIFEHGMRTGQHIYTHDDAGHLVRRVRLRANGDPLRVDEYEVDEHGHRLVWEGRNDGHDIVDERHEMVRDPHGRMLEERVCLNQRDVYLGGALKLNRCAPHIHTRLEYDNDGRLVREAIDEDVDGTVDRTVSYAHDVRGNLLTRTFAERGVTTDVLTSVWACPD